MLVRRTNVISRRLLFWLLLALAPFALAACSDTSSALGQNFQGRILLVNVVEINRTDELRYSTIDPSQVIRKWRMRPSAEGLELLLMRIRVENHIAVNAVFVADERAAIIRDFFQNDYRPISVTDTVYLDWRGQADVTVTLEGGECTEGARLVVNAGTKVQWVGSGDSTSVIQFGPGVLPALGDDPVLIAPGGSVSHRFDQPGTFDYQCGAGGGTAGGAGEAPAQSAQVLVEDAGSVRGRTETNILFLEGTFELAINTGVDGWMVFEVPIDTKIRDLRWRAGDSITIRF